jgi:hypothetical protein
LRSSLKRLGYIQENSQFTELQIKNMFLSFSVPANPVLSGVKGKVVSFAPDTDGSDKEGKRDVTHPNEGIFHILT